MESPKTALVADDSWCTDVQQVALCARCTSIAFTCSEYTLMAKSPNMHELPGAERRSDATAAIRKPSERQDRPPPDGLDTGSGEGAPASADEKAVLEPPPASGPRLMGQQQMTMMTEVHLRLFRHIEDIHRTWTVTVQKTRESETKFARRLIDCADPGEAVTLCSEWLAARAAAFAAESQRFTNLWLSLYSDAVSGTWHGAEGKNAGSSPKGGSTSSAA